LLTIFDSPCQLERSRSTLSRDGVLCLLSVLDPPSRLPHQPPIDILMLLLEILSPPPLTLMSSRNMLFADDQPNAYNGRDVFRSLSRRRRDFYFVVGETPETFVEMYATVAQALQPPCRNRLPTRISRLNRLLLTLMWLRSYPCYTIFSTIFDVSPSHASRVVNLIWTICLEYYRPNIQWPTRRQWRRN
jgi:hypothetical protein